MTSNYKKQNFHSKSQRYGVKINDKETKDRIKSNVISEMNKRTSVNTKRSNTPLRNRTNQGDATACSVYSGSDTKSMHKTLNNEFLLFQLLMKKLISIDKGSGNNKKSLTVYTHFHPDDEKDRSIMVEFDTKYHRSKALYWYTRESIIYRILNKSLRTHQINDVLVFGPFIKDIYDQLHQEYKGFMKLLPSPTFNVYRGQLMAIDEVNRMKTTVGQLIAMNSFLSTSTNRKKAIEFATAKPATNELTNILLEINVDSRYFTKPY
ncbi:unnamed protein product, partial [Didymodactylos carnosus]